ncbi:MAG: 4-hydroxy-tetrahydrodipicolinate reductase [Nostocales cyanobacterium LacPavin_0920_SED1_MAG_38_18]|jgi:4-hydroxy-tetrahydrodipicolinate reductase|uniref:4-hydroxy-tetrahydrodipicolinate reductase n=1 Tax=Aphanizomenon flos-aquae FACHB-1040 TaxID=2692887 RepID=A0ABR8BVV7_APHFL|nr:MULTISPECIES: 4-hydroxy-tetrahydrodipicolinate reductase [Aphanizomenon]MCX5981790.1 4-hydroxy-tetrahydrodipicolinate reductase [Nostocales cyanobacterium LacPavin_0920_SED1_MAG_38_18]QSV70692.1 MAG: 4-hydroxy-tetrahydrodipicolinate reductase [Aphanizomenon flos-aquae KM1D3_PB]KHG42702.1 dihydrodipicolinate reductase [Aphanizomenon flos-aquae 2012/KM1/D3]MBD2279023.1 4-hydroxy-tetrahydrodipicolinate reductase [Aphanizomenon flos-aquae FACHB-1040]MTJ30737.1 4-hydroxy-tetrahydrodipicolinate r
MSNQTSIPVIVNGAAGKMGREVIKAVAAASDLTLMGAIDTTPEHQGKDAGELAGLSEPLEVPITNQLEPMLAYVAGERQMQPGVLVDFTHPDAVYNNIRSAIAYGIRPVVGTTGLSPAQLEELADFAEKASTGCLVIPNFSIGMVLLQEAALRASQYFDHVEIIELHHNQKADAPSGTAIQTAQLLAEMGKTFNTAIVEETEKIPGARGSLADEGIRIHSIRLPGLIAHQEVIFGAAGQIYTLRHDTSDRACYMPGVILAIRKVNQLKSLVYGLEKIL